MRSIVVIPRLLLSAVASVPLFACAVATDAPESAPDESSVQSATEELTSTPFDTTFDHDGGAWVGSYFNFTPSGIAVRDDHKIMYSSRIVIGDSTYFGLGRATADGAMDGTFEQGGYPKLLNHMLAADQAWGGEVLAVGTKTAAVGIVERSGHRKPVFLRFNDNGSPDTSLGGKGYVDFNPPGGFDHSGFEYLKRDAKGRFVALGLGWKGGLPYTTGAKATFIIARFDANGKLDPTFNSDGWATMATASQLWAFDLAIGKGRNDIVIMSSSDATPDDRLIRLNEAGHLDTTFATTGITDLHGRGTDVTVAHDGRVFVVYRPYNDIADGDDGVSVRGYLANGQPNLAFSKDIGFVNMGNLISDHLNGGGGEVITFDDDLDRMYIAGDGYLTRSANDKPSVLRILALRPDGNLDKSFSGDGEFISVFGSAHDVWSKFIALDGEKFVVGTWGENEYAGDVAGFALQRYLIGAGNTNQPCHAGNMCNTDRSCGAAGATNARYHICQAPPIPTPPTPHTGDLNEACSKDKSGYYCNDDLNVMCKDGYCKPRLAGDPCSRNATCPGGATCNIIPFGSVCSYPESCTVHAYVKTSNCGGFSDICAGGCGESYDSAEENAKMQLEGQTCLGSGVGCCDTEEVDSCP